MWLESEIELVLIIRSIHYQDFTRILSLSISILQGSLPGDHGGEQAHQLAVATPHLPLSVPPFYFFLIFNIFNFELFK